MENNKTNKQNIVWHDHNIVKADRNKLLRHNSALIWFTGLSGSGKSTIASILQKKLLQEKILTYILDGDNVRYGLNSDLGFSDKDRVENIRRLGEVAKLFVDAGVITLTAFISPFIKDRDSVREKLSDLFIEVYVRCPIDVCEKRDPKGLYKKARNNEIKDFTGIDSPYEEPINPELVVDSSRDNPIECADKIYNYLKENKLI